MPFTPAHAAAALPFRWLTRRLPLDALVVGTMSPDFEYLLRLAPHGGFAHTPRGVVVFCLPLALLVVTAYRLLVRPAAVALLPSGAAGEGRPGLDPGAITLAAVGALVGATTHLLWDGFTHESGWFVALIPWLRESVLGIARFRIAQHASTVLGGAVLLWAGAAWWRSHLEGRTPTPAERRRIARAVVTVAAFAAAATLLNWVRALYLDADRVLGYAAVGALIGCGAGLLAVGILHRARARR